MRYTLCSSYLLVNVPHFTVHFFILKFAQEQRFTVSSLFERHENPESCNSSLFSVAAKTRNRTANMPNQGWPSDHRWQIQVHLLSVLEELEGIILTSGQSNWTHWKPNHNSSSKDQYLPHTRHTCYLQLL
jgi:hypothetical protein